MALSFSRCRCVGSFLALSLVFGACASSSAPVADAQVAALDPPHIAELEPASDLAMDAVGDESSEPLQMQARALEACQEAEALLDTGDSIGAIARVDEAFGLLLLLPEDEAYAQAKQDIRLVVSQVINQAYGQSGAHAVVPGVPMTSRDAALALVENDHVAREIKSFTTNERQQFLDAYKRSGRYRPMILEKLAEAGLPSQLSWLPLVESLFKVNALSHASALGLWQFISSTGLRYGLKRDEWMDERLDPEKATDAAVAYLSELHRLFGDWQKALAAYNCGESRIQRLQKRSETEYLDFWDLYLLLPHETRRYVPRLIAVLKILEDPAAHGMELPELDTPLSNLQTVTLERAIKLTALDQALGLAPGTLQSFNPALRHDSTPKTQFALRVPQEFAEKLLEVQAALPEYVPPKPKFITHRVRSGETLSRIAERYRTSVSVIMRTNNLRSANRLWPGQRLRIPGG